MQLTYISVSLGVSPAMGSRKLKQERQNILSVGHCIIKMGAHPRNSVFVMLA